MTFLYPLFLWSLLALIPLAAIYFLKVRPRRKSTPAYFLWEKIFSEKRATSLFNKLRDLFSLLLMLLAFALLALALARPELSSDDRKDLLLLIDHSASMSAKDGLQTRLDSAKKAAREIAVALDGNQRAAVAAVGRDIEFLSHLSESPRELIDAIDQISPSYDSISLAALTALGKDSHKSGDYRIVLISDGNFAGSDEMPENIEWFKVGQPARNLGVVGADLERLPDGRLGFYFQVASSFAEEKAADLILRSAESGQIAKLIPINAKPGLNPAETFYLDEAPDGKWIAELDLEDDFSSDNLVYLSVAPVRPVRVQVAAENRFFFETSVLAFQSGGGLLQLVDENPQIVIEQGASQGTEELSVVFTPSGESPWWKSIGDDADAVAPREVIEDHPVLKHIDLSGLAFIGAKEIEPADGSLVLVESETGNPLVYRASHEGKSALVVNLDPVESEFYFSAWFPVLVHGAATHLAGREEDLAPVYRPGDRFSIPGFREGVETVLLAERDGANDASGDGESEEPEVWNKSEFGPIDRLGFFDFRNPSGDWTAASSLLSKADSLLDNAALEATAEPISRGQSPAYWLIVLAILLLAAESVLYHLRKVG